MRPLSCAAALLLLCSSPALAQGHEATLEGSFVRGAVGYARDVRPDVMAGIEVGFGFPQLDRTLRPEQNDQGGPDFEEYLHVGLFVRLARSEHLEVDVGLRGAVADLYECGSSDCLPVLFGGAYVQPMVGWRRLKFGPRLTAGWIRETEPGEPDGSTGVVALSPFTARFTIAW